MPGISQALAGCLLNAKGQIWDSLLCLLAPELLFFCLTTCLELWWSVLRNIKQQEGGRLPGRRLPVGWPAEPRCMKPEVNLVESCTDVRERSRAAARPFCDLS